MIAIKAWVVPTRAAAFLFRAFHYHRIVFVCGSSSGGSSIAVAVERGAHLGLASAQAIPTAGRPVVLWSTLACNSDMHRQMRKFRAHPQ
eukprot:SAG11_NODE_567_length_8488_cov_4.292764_4_plen_89_part_00